MTPLIKAEVVHRQHVITGTTLLIARELVGFSSGEDNSNVLSGSKFSRFQVFCTYLVLWPTTSPIGYISTNLHNVADINLIYLMIGWVSSYAVGVVLSLYYDDCSVFMGLLLSTIVSISAFLYSWRYVFSQSFCFLALLFPIISGTCMPQKSVSMTACSILCHSHYMLLIINELLAISQFFGVLISVWSINRQEIITWPCYSWCFELRIFDVYDYVKNPLVCTCELVRTLELVNSYILWFFARCVQIIRVCGWA